MFISNYCYSPLEQFEVINLIGLQSPLFAFNLSLTNLGLFTIIGVTLLTVIHMDGVNGLSLVQNRFSLFVETVYSTIGQMVKDQIGSRNEVYLPFIYALFTFILVLNLIGNVTYTFAATTSAVVAIGLSLIVWLGVTFLIIDRHRVHAASYLVPQGCPLVLVPVLVLIELISYMARAVSLGLRLACNLVAGHTLMVILGGFLFKGFSSSLLMFFVTIIPFGLFLAIVGLEIAVSFIQAYVFTILTCIYIKDSLDLH